MSDKNRNLIEALLVERRAYLRRNLSDRVASVDAALASAGYVAPGSDKELAAVEPTSERAVSSRGRKRKTV